jgi:hypothetical protein
VFRVVRGSKKRQSIQHPILHPPDSNTFHPTNNGPGFGPTLITKTIPFPPTLWAGLPGNEYTSVNEWTYPYIFWNPPSPKNEIP